MDVCNSVTYFNDAAKSATRYEHIFLLRRIKSYRISYKLHKKSVKVNFRTRHIFFVDNK